MLNELWAVVFSKATVGSLAAALSFGGLLIAWQLYKLSNEVSRLNMRVIAMDRKIADLEEALTDRR